MAAALNLSSQAISKWENGLTLPDITLLPEISVYFGVTIDDNDLVYAQNFLLSQLAQQKNSEYCMQLLPALYNRKAEEYRKKAEYYAKDALTLFPDNHNNHSNLNEAQQGATGDWNLDNQAERILYYKEFLKKHPESTESWRWYIGTLLSAGRCDEAPQAIEILEKLYKKDGNENLHTDIYRGQLLWEQGCHEESLACFEKITAKHQEKWLAWSCVGDATGAIEAWETYIRILNEDWNTTEGTYIDRAKRKIHDLRK